MLNGQPLPGTPWWVYAGSFLVAILVAFVTARGPVWVEKIKQRSLPPPPPPPSADSTDVGVTILREWLAEAQQQRDAAVAEVERLERRIHQLEVELYRLGWDGRTA